MGYWIFFIYNHFLCQCPQYICNVYDHFWVGVGGLFLSYWPLSTMCMGPLIFCKCHHWRCLNNCIDVELSSPVISQLDDCCHFACFFFIHYTPCITKLLGGIVVSLHPSICPASRVHSVAPTVLVGSISYLYTLSSNVRICVVCKVKIWIFGSFFFKFVTLTLFVLTWDLMWITSMGNHGAVGVSQNADVLVVLVLS